MKKMNEFKGKVLPDTRAYVSGSTVELGTVLESCGNVCLVEMGKSKTLGIYNLSEHNGDMVLSVSHYLYGDDDRKVGKPDEVRALYNRIVQLTEETEARKVAKSAQPVTSTKALKFAEVHRLLYKATGELRVMMTEAVDIDTLLKDKGAKRLIEAIQVYNVLLADVNPKIIL